MTMTKSDVTKVFVFLLALMSFLFLSPYFLWTTYPLSDPFLLFYKLIQIMVVAIGLYYFIFYSKPGKNDVIFAVFILLIYFGLNLRIYKSGIHLDAGTVIKGIILSYLFLLNAKEKRMAFDIFKWIFAVSLIPAILIFTADLLRAEIPYTILQPVEIEKVNKDMWFRQYPLAVVIDASYYKGNIRRLCGMFNEPGVVGTLSALLLCADQFRLKHKLINKIVLLGGIFSFSLAFFLLSVAYLTLFYAFKSIKKLFAAGAALIILLASLHFLFPDNYFLNVYIFDRIKITSEGLSGNNRTSSEFDQFYSDFWKEDNVIFGEGKGYGSGYSTSSYKTVITSNGVWGIGVILLFLFSYTIVYSKRETIPWFFLAAYLLSFYQRPDIINCTYLLLICGGIWTERSMGSKAVMQSNIQHTIRRKRIFAVASRKVLW